MWDQKMWDGHSCPSPLTLVLILIRPSMLRLFLVSNSDQTQKRRTGVSVPHKPSAARPSRKEGGDFDFPCRESKSQWTYARGIPPFATNAKDGAPAKLEYIRQNPVRRGLVEKPEDYPWLWLEPSLKR